MTTAEKNMGHFLLTKSSQFFKLFSLSPLIVWILQICFEGMETCKVLESSLEGLVDDAIRRRTSLVLEGVSLVPSTKWIEKWENSGGLACGVLLTVTKEEVHRNLLRKRGFITGNQDNEQKKLDGFNRVRLIQDEMIQRAQKSGWVLIEQKIEPDPLEIIENEFLGKEGCSNPFFAGMKSTTEADSVNEEVTDSNDRIRALIEHEVTVESPNGGVDVSSPMS